MALTRVWIPTPNYSSRGSGVRLVVLHTAEGALTYQSLGSFFANPASGVSSHTGIDDTPNTVGEYVRADFKAWTQGNANPYSVAAELCAFAEWGIDEWHRHPTMLENAARWVAEECGRFGIPLRSLSADEAQSGVAGVCDHVDLGASGGGHWDCGPGFPMDEVIAMAGGAASPGPGPSPIEPPTPEPKEEPIVISEVIQHRGFQLSCAQATNGQLWHKYSGDGGLTWASEPLIRPNGIPVKATVKDTVSISSVNGTLFIATEDEDNAAWMCRQGPNFTDGWDIRQLP